MRKPLELPVFGLVATHPDGWQVVDWWPHTEKMEWRTIRLYAPGATSSAETWWFNWNGRELHLAANGRPLDPTVRQWLAETLKNTVPKSHLLEL